MHVVHIPKHVSMFQKGEEEFVYDNVLICFFPVQMSMYTIGSPKSATLG